MSTPPLPPIAFVGAGKMASAIVRGLLASGTATPAQLACIGGTGATAPRLAADTGIRLATGVDDLLAGTDIVLLACKPQQFAALDPRLPDLAAGKLVVSVLAGFSAARLAATFPRARAAVAAMPNTPAQIGAGVTTLCAAATTGAATTGDAGNAAADAAATGNAAAKTIAPADAALAERIFASCGTVVWVEPALMDAAGAANGCGPGYFFELVHAFELAAQRAGLPPDLAAALVRGTFIGSAKLLERTGTAPEELRNAVTSPNGSTHAGLRVFEEHRLRDTFAAAVAASARRAAELGKM